MTSILGASIVTALLLPVPALAQAAQTTVGPGGLRLPQVTADQPSAPAAGSDGAVAPPSHVESLQDAFHRPLSATAEPPPNPLFIHRPEPTRR